MNDLNLRVSGGIGEKVKKPAAPISMPYWNLEIQGGDGEFISKFLNCKSADSQLKILKQFLTSYKDDSNQETIKFLVSLFWHADSKHPVKGFLKKHITDSKVLRQAFMETLTTVISAEIENSEGLLYGDYIGTVTRLEACLDKFPPGAEVISSLEINVIIYLIHCLQSCIKRQNDSRQIRYLPDVKPVPLSPTEFSKIYDVMHLTLRLVLYMLQKAKYENSSSLQSEPTYYLSRIRTILVDCMTFVEVPMDTRCLSGLVFLALNMYEWTGDQFDWSWLLSHNHFIHYTFDLSAYSALATVIPPEELAAVKINEKPAVLVLTDAVLKIGDRYSSDASYALAVARTVLAISKGLNLTGAPLTERLARYCWNHMAHHMDSVRHLAAQTMARVVETCVRLKRKGDPTALENIFTSLSLFDCTTKSFYVTMTALAEQLGRGVLACRPDVIRDVINALHHQGVQACATTFLETLLRKHMQKANTETIYKQWICVILEAVKRESDPTVLGILERILTKAVQSDNSILQYILPEDRALNSYEGSDLKCILLVLGVVRKSGAAYKAVTFDDLRHTAYDADDGIRLLSLSLVAETPRSTEPFSADELSFLLHFLDYNVNAQSPSFRQRVLALMKKILKRLEGSYKVLVRKEAQNATEIAAYLKFVSDLRDQCLYSLVPGGNYGRRGTALQLLVWEQALQVSRGRKWTEEHAETLYYLLEDSYENNKALALDVLKNCPVDLIKPVQAPGYLEQVLTQASSVRPTECVAASYKLLLLLSLPVGIPGEEANDIPERRHYTVLHRILTSLKEQTTRAEDIARAALDAPMYGLVHSLARVTGCCDVRAIAGDPQWLSLITDMIVTCGVVNSLVACVVNAASPEGLLPEDLASTEADSSGGTRLADGRAVTAQMVLLCAWRSVKETSLLLGSLASRLTIEGEDHSWTLSVEVVEYIGRHLMELLSSVKHRGAFEQAYVGFTLLLGRLWKCSSRRLYQLPLEWFSSIERGFELPAAAVDDPAAGEYCATRRGAGLPFMIQALVTTELAAESTVPHGRLLTRCLALCLRVARAPPAPADAARAHLVLRALYRHTVPAAEPTAEAIMVAVKGFEADTWTERNSSTLLFSALTVRVFGVQRARGTLSARNTMTGRVFFLRYPALYDFLLEQLQSVTDESSLRPSLFPTLLLMARLYPSALEGTVSNLKLERFLPHLESLAGAREISTRRLAARAAAPLVPPHRYVAQVLWLLLGLKPPLKNMNFCHGQLCQLGVVLELPSAWTLDELSRSELLKSIRWTFWILEQATGDAPCYIVADEYIKVFSYLLLRFPNLLKDDIASVSKLLETALLSARAGIGREIFLSNTVYMLLIVSPSRERNIDIILRSLQHRDYEVNLSALNYLLLLHGKNDDDSSFLEHLSKKPNENILEDIVKQENYIKLLCDVSQNGYLECKKKALKVLTLTNDTQEDIVKLKLGINTKLTDEIVIKELIDYVLNGQANLISIYLESLLRLVSKSDVSLEVVRVLHLCSGAGNDEETREVVVGFLETHLGTLLEKVPSTDEAEAFEWSATLWAVAAILLEDDAVAVRQRAADAVLNVVRGTDTTSRTALSVHLSRQWRRLAAAHTHGAALLLVLAALDFCAVVDTGDELGEECRVFDQSETHNVYLEDFTWARDCATEIKRIYRQTNTTQTIEEYLQSLLCNPTYKDTIEKLCIQNVTDYLTGRLKSNNKIDLFLKALYK